MIKNPLSDYKYNFQRYYWVKKTDPIWNESRPFPRDVDNLMHDTLEAVRPKLHICRSYEEAIQAAEDIEKEYKSKIGNSYKSKIGNSYKSNIDNSYKSKIAHQYKSKIGNSYKSKIGNSYKSKIGNSYKSPDR